MAAIRSEHNRGGRGVTSAAAVATALQKVRHMASDDSKHRRRSNRCRRVRCYQNRIVIPSGRLETIFYYPNEKEKEKSMSSKDIFLV